MQRVTAELHVSSMIRKLADGCQLMGPLYSRFSTQNYYMWVFFHNVY